MYVSPIGVVVCAITWAGIGTGDTDADPRFVMRFEIPLFCKEHIGAKSVAVVTRRADVVAVLQVSADRIVCTIDIHNNTGHGAIFRFGQTMLHGRVTVGIARTYSVFSIVINVVTRIRICVTFAHTNGH